MIGQTYTHSGKFEFSKVLAATLIGIVVASLFGLFYGFITELNPFIYLNFIILIVILAILWVSVKGLSKFSRSRNMAVNIILGLIFGFVAWYAGWCFYVSKLLGINYFSAFIQPKLVKDFIIVLSNTRVIEFGRLRSSSNIEISGIGLQILYAIEFLCFMAVAVAARKPAYYNEEFQFFYEEKNLFAVVDETFADELNKAQTGKYPFFKDITFYATLEEVSGTSGSHIIEAELNYADQVKDHGILTIEQGILTFDKDKKNEISKKKKILKDTYIDSTTLNILLKKEHEGQSSDVQDIVTA